jgi:hypothetical protein
MAHDTDSQVEVADWRLATWDGARREQIRRWRELPLEHVVAALEEMADLSARLSPPRTRRSSPTDGSEGL